MTIEGLFKKKPHTDITQFGAVGDGTTNDRAAIQNAFNEARDSGHPVYVPPTDDAYLVEGRLDINKSHSGLTIFGDGYDSHITRPDETDPEANAHILNSVGVDNLTIYNCRFSNAPIENIKVIDAENAYICRIWSHETQEDPGDGLELQEVSNCVVQSSIFWKNAQDGIHVTEGCENITVSNCYSVEDGQDDSFGGLGTRDAENISFNNCTVVDSQFRAFNCDSDDVTYSDCRVVGASDRAWRVSGENVNIINPTIKGTFEGNQVIFGAKGSTQLTIRDANIDVAKLTDVNEIIEIRADSSNVHGGVIDANNSASSFVVRIRGSNTRISDLDILNNPDSDAMGIRSAATDVWVQNILFKNHSTALEIRDTGTTDIRFSQCLFEDTNLLSDFAGNVYWWNGIIGGGPFGGIDFSSVAGRQNGDVAMSDGAAGGFPARSQAVWDGAQWVRVDGQETITPT